MNVVDTTIPEITLVGDASMTIEAPTPYVEQGATATDNYDDAALLTAAIVVGGDTVDETTPGVYEVTYDVTDANGNDAVQVKRTVTVQDTASPVISLVGDDPHLVEVFSAADYSTLDPGATATDAIDNDATLTAAIVANASLVHMSVVGSYPVTYDVTDSSGNPASQVTRTVKVVDTTPPALFLTGANPQFIEILDPYLELGATAADAVNGDVTDRISIDASAVDTTKLGVYKVTYDVKDLTGNQSVPIVRSVEVVERTGPLVERLGGVDRYDTARTVVDEHYRAPGGPVFIATGEAFPDALVSAVPAAGSDAPILLTGRDSLPPATIDALERLSPSVIYVIGGTSAISGSVAQQLGDFGPVERVAGPDRYSTAVQIASRFFDDPDTVDTVFVATGLGYADALVAAAPAGRDGIPLLLVPGDRVPPSVEAELRRLDPGQIIVVGGERAVSASVVYSLGSIAPVQRISGEDRFATAAALVNTFFEPAPPVSTAFVATGRAYPDALVAAAAAGRAGAPVLLVDSDAIPDPIHREIVRLGPDLIYVVGGPAAVSAGVVSRIDW